MFGCDFFKVFALHINHLYAENGTLAAAMGKRISIAGNEELKITILYTKNSWI
jgi:hypothetical protein